MRSLLVVSIVVLFAAQLGSPAYAQPPSQMSVSAIGGVGKTLDDEGSLGGGWLLGAAIDRVVFGTTRVELSFEAITHDRDSGYFASEGRTLIGGVSLLHRYGTGAALPYLFGGITVGHHSGTNVFNGEPAPRSNTDAGLRFGFGVAFRAGDRWEISPEIRLNGFFIDNDADPATLPSFGVRVGWRP
jgi:opacity protein-like surface antigen